MENNKLHERIKELESALRVHSAYLETVADVVDGKLGCDSAAKGFRGRANTLNKLIEKGVSQ